MTAANPKPPFTVKAAVIRGFDCAQVIDSDATVLAAFNCPDRQARAEALAADYGQTYGPEWVDMPSDSQMLNRRTGQRYYLPATPMRLHVIRLLNEHGGPQ